MKSVSLLKSVFVIAAIGLMEPVFSDGNIGEQVDNTGTIEDPQAPSPRHCELPFVEEVSPAHALYIFKKQTFACAVEIEGINFGVMFRNSENISEIVGNYCNLVPSAENCVALILTQGEECLNSTQNQVIKSTSELVLNFLRVACRDNGQKLATILTEFKNMVEIHSSTLAKLETCEDDVNTFVKSKGAETQLATLYSEMLYNSVKFVKNCIKERVVGHEEAKNAFDSLIGDLLDRLKCIGPDGAQISCETED